MSFATNVTPADAARARASHPAATIGEAFACWLLTQEHPDTQDIRLLMYLGWLENTASVELHEMGSSFTLSHERNGTRGKLTFHGVSPKLQALLMKYFTARESTRC